MSRSAGTRPVVRVEGLDDDTNALIQRLLAKLDQKMPRNMLRTASYDGKRAARQVSAVLPPSYRNLAIVLGWTAKAVDLLARRCKLETFTWADGSLDDLGFQELWDANMLGSEVGQGLKSSLLHSTTFAITTFGMDDEPDVVVQFREATAATGDWNTRRRALDTFLTVTSYDADGHLDGFVLYEYNVTTTCARVGSRWVISDRQEHVWGVPVEPMPYNPSLGRPFGRSRITRPMIGLQDSAVRALLRLEGHMDVYSFPEMWMLGADPSIFRDPSGQVQQVWDVMIGRIKGIPDDESATNPRADVKQMQAASPEPHLADLNVLSKLFAREASLPDSSVAITDFANPTSAESYDASQNDLISEAEGATDDWTPSLRRTGVRMLAMQNRINGMDEVPAEWWSIAPKWRNPRFVSRAAEADAGMKQISVVPELAQSDVGLELLGLNAEQIRRFRADQRKARGAALIASMAATPALDGGGGADMSAAQTSLDEANVLKAKADALGVLRRAGVDADEAARLAGLGTVKFIPGAPITIKAPEAGEA